MEIGELLIPILFGVLLVIAVVTGSSTILSSVAEEKETRMIEMLVTSAAPLSIMSGKLLALGLAGLIQIAVWVIAGAFALPAIFDRIPSGGELTITPDLMALVVVTFIVGYLLFAALALFMAALVPSTQDSQRQMSLLGILPFVPYWLVGLFINVPDTVIIQVLTYFPFTAPTMIMLRLGLGSVSGGEMATSSSSAW